MFTAQATHKPTCLAAYMSCHLVSFVFVPANYPECMEAAVPFMCRYYFPLKDCDNGLVYRASRDDCVSISTSVCAIPWQIASAVFPDRLPDCYTLSVAG